MSRAGAAVTPLRETEAEWQEWVVGFATHHGWRVAHFRPARTVKGWRTPVAVDGAGFPDLILARGERLVVTELKTDRGRVDPEQRAWLAAFRATGVEVYLWRPRDRLAVARVLGTGGPACAA